MNLKNNKLKEIILIILIIIPTFIVVSKFGNLKENSILYKTDIIKNSGDEIIPSRDWISDGDFSSSTNWVNGSVGGDTRDISSDYYGEEYNTYILGDKKSKSIILNSTPSVFGEWEAFSKPEDPLVPNNGYGVDSNGVYCSHNFNDNGADQLPIIHFKREASMEQSMDDYKITSASLEVNIDSEVDFNIDTPQDNTDGNDANNDNDEIDQEQSYDFARFYIEISDLNTDKINTYEVGSNQTVEFGYGNPAFPGGTSYFDGPMEIKDEQVIIDSLTNVFKVHSTNFTVILGIYIYCADNQWGADEDYWNLLTIDYVNLTFNYEKIIDQSTSIELNQECGSFSDDLINNGFTGGENLIINSALFNFSYKLSDSWPPLSPNSEIRILINNDPEYLFKKLISGSTSPEEFSFDFTNIIDYTDNDVNITIQVYIADEFNLNKIIIISIDDVSLEIEYTVLFGDYSTFLEVEIEGQAYGGTFYIPVMREIDIVVRYLNDSSGHIPDANVIIKGDISRDLVENSGFGQYEITLNTTDDLRLGENTLIVEASKKNYILNDTTIIIYVQPINAEITGHNFINNEIEASTNAPEFVQLYLNDTDNDLPITGATVTYTGGLGNGIFTDPDEDGIYNATIIANSDGYYSITVSAVAGTDYSFTNYQFAFNSTTPANSTADLTIYLNDNVIPPVAGYLSIASMRNVNITAVFVNNTDGDPIFGAGVKLEDNQDRFIGNLIWDSGHYTVEISTSDDLDIGPNTLKVSAEAIYFGSPLEISFIIDVQPIQTKISLYHSTASLIEINTGDSAFIEVILNDTDNNLLIFDAVLTYIWEFGSGVLLDLDGDGIYNTTIQNVPEGSHTITISAIVQGDYSFNDFEIVISAIKPQGGDPLLYIIIAGALGMAVIGLGTYFVIYQKILKYPPTVRKIRKLKGKISKRKKPRSIDFSDRKSYIKEIYEERKISTEPVSYKSEVKK